MGRDGTGGGVGCMVGLGRRVRATCGRSVDRARAEAKEKQR